MVTNHKHVDSDTQFPLISKLFVVICIGAIASFAQNDTLKTDSCTTYPNPQIKFDHKDSVGRIYIPVVNWSVYPNKMFRQAPELPPCGSNTKSSRTWVDIFNADNNTKIYGFCALDSSRALQSIWFKPPTPNGKVYIVLDDRACKKTYKSNIIEYGECNEVYPIPKIKFDHTDSVGRVYIPVVNWSAYPNDMFRQAPELPPCGLNTKASRTWVNIFNANNNEYIYGFCALGSNSDLQSIWFKPSTPNGKIYIVLDDRACKKTYKSNIITYGECTGAYPVPQIKFDHKDSVGRVYIPVVNWSAYPNDMFRQAPELPSCGTNTKSSRTWVTIYNANNNMSIYGFCALGSNTDLQAIWFKPPTPKGKVYIVLNDRACKKTYKSNMIEYGECNGSYPDPQIKLDHTDSVGRVYIPVLNWSAYPNDFFRQAPELPPCGLNTKSSRTWVDIVNADNNENIYGFCALGSNSDLQSIWFKPPTPNGKIYIVLNDRACKKTYKSNVIEYGECSKVYPIPQIKFDHKDSVGRVYIPVVNWPSYSNEMFRQAPELPPCGANTKASRTWVNIYNADNNEYIYGFCAFGSNKDLQLIWFKPSSPNGKAYIILDDRACKKTYKSNTITW